jgi:hypothetical protein
MSEMLKVFIRRQQWGEAALEEAPVRAKCTEGDINCGDYPRA